MNPLRAKCPTCGAPAGVHCTENGVARKAVHPDRARLADEEAGRVERRRPSNKPRRRKIRSVRTVPGGGFETNRRRH